MYAVMCRNLHCWAAQRKIRLFSEEAVSIFILRPPHTGANLHTNLVYAMSHILLHANSHQCGLMHENFFSIACECCSFATRCNFFQADRKIRMVPPTFARGHHLFPAKHSSWSLTKYMVSWECSTFCQYFMFTGGKGGI